MGGGVIGVSTAWYLAKEGCTVTVIERQANTGLETSFANCGQLSSGYATPWAAPGMWWKAIKWLFVTDAPLQIKPDGSLLQLKWLGQLLLNCRKSSYEINKSRILCLAEYSRHEFKVLRDELNFHYEDRQLGTLQLFRAKEQLKHIYKDIQVLEKYEVPYQVLDAAGCGQVEPALAGNSYVKGGLLLPNDETGDCYLFTQLLTNECKKLGVKFITNTVITGIERGGNKISCVWTGSERWVADHYIVALGAFSRGIMCDLGLKIPVYPVKGYSLTLPLFDTDCAPLSTILDETYKVAITRFDKRIRVGGMAELSGYNLKLNPLKQQILLKVFNELFPNCANATETSFWAGLRPMTPDSTPIIGHTTFKNLSLNTGHGTLGFTMCLGSGKYLAWQLLGKTPEIVIDGLEIARYA